MHANTYKKTLGLFSTNQCQNKNKMGIIYLCGILEELERKKHNGLTLSAVQVL